MEAQDVEPHATEISILESLPEQVPVGVSGTLTVALECEVAEAAQDLRIELRDTGGDTLSVAELAPDEESGQFTAVLSFSFPKSVGEHNWVVVFPEQGVDGARLASSQAFLSFSTRPHRIALSAWDLPAPATAEERYTIKVGAKCLDGCDLSGQELSLHGDAGKASFASTTLGDEPWAGTSALLWEEMDISAPAEEGETDWSIQMDTSEVDLPHEAVPAPVRFRVAPRASQSVQVRVVNAETHDPVSAAQVRIGPYRGKTDGNGIATVQVACGDHPLTVWKPAFETPRLEIHVDGDTSINIELTEIPVEDEDALWGP